MERNTIVQQYNKILKIKNKELQYYAVKMLLSNVYTYRVLNNKQLKKLAEIEKNFSDWEVD